jgi:hypothetical protein
MYEITSLGLTSNLNNMKNYITDYIYEIHIIRNLTNIKKHVCIHIMEYIKYMNFTFTLLNGTN